MIFGRAAEEPTRWITVPTPIPRFEVDGLIDETGLDPEATPRWLMVGHFRQ